MSYFNSPSAIGGQAPSTPISPAATASVPDVTAVLRRAHQFDIYNQEFGKFFRELVSRYEYLQEQYQTSLKETDTARHWALKWQAEMARVDATAKMMQRAAFQNACIAVLIDGDGMIFEDEFLREGEKGGRRAASTLHAAVRNFAENETNDIASNVDIICRIYANVGGLSDVLVRAGIIQETVIFQNFIRGFTRGKILFDFVDVGAGKDRADEKINGNLKRLVQDYQCQRVFFGCSHDNGYARVLEKYIDQPDVLNKVTLLEGVPFEKELTDLPYETKKFSGIFRDSKIYTWNKIQTFMPTNKKPAGDSPVTYNILPGLPSRFPPAPRIASNPLFDSPLPTVANPNLIRTPSSSTLASDHFPVLKPSAATHSWAAKAAAPPPPVETTPAYKPANREEVIARNRAGQRVDPVCKDYDKAEVDRIKKIKMCNVHFLRKECMFDTSCSHLHTYKPTDQEIATLRLVARMAPCSNGSSCQDIKCFYGHCCPAPPAKNAVKGTKSCIFGEMCKFPVELHDIDRNVVKTLVIR